MSGANICTAPISTASITRKHAVLIDADNRHMTVPLPAAGEIHVPFQPADRHGANALHPCQVQR
jgi:hypothetical protein